MSAFDKAFFWMIPHEVGSDLKGGGYTNDPDDPGGETKFGISKRYNPEVDIKNLTIDKAKNIYLVKYWQEMRLEALGDVSPRVATKVFDTGVHTGQVTGCRLLQNALNLLETDTSKWLIEDGVIGPKTIAKVVKFGDTAVLEKFCKVQHGYYISRNKPKYMKGFLKRAMDIPGEDDV